MKIGSIELDDWTLTTTAEPVRYSVNYRADVDACVVLYRKYINDLIYVWAWHPSFNHKLYFLNEVFDKSYGPYIKGTDKQAKDVIDEFLIRINTLITFI